MQAAKKRKKENFVDGGFFSSFLLKSQTCDRCLLAWWDYIKCDI